MTERLDGIWATAVGGERPEPPAPDEVASVLDEVAIDAYEPRTALLLAIADDELVSGHRASHWTGVAPSLEEDIAFSGIAQDEINHADVFYQLIAADAGGADGDRAIIDRLGLGRRPDEYRHAVLCERPPRDFAYSLARHFLYDHADAVRLAALSESSDPEVAAIARKLAHEERYHLEHADTWFIRLANGDEEQRSRLAAGLRDAFGEALWLFEPTPGEAEVVDAGVLPVPSRELLTRCLDLVGAMLEEADMTEVMDEVSQADDGTWDVPDDLFAAPGGRHGEHTSDWTEDAWVEMTALHRAHPGARW